MKVLIALILASIGVGGVSAMAAPSTPSSIQPTTVAAAPVAARDAFERPPRMVHTIVVAKPAAAPVKAAKPVVKKPAKKKHKTYVTTARVRANLDRGILPSAYTGPYYDARYEAFRRCVVKRESEGRYGARNHGSGAAGAYQFMPAWTRTIQKWTGEHKPIYAMSRYAQDLAFWRAFNHGKGAHNWAGGRWHC